jgi:natural product precursor
MKNLSKLKLIQFDKDELEARQMNVLKGGSGYCRCTCPEVCYCPSWDGTGLMPPGQSTTDMGKTDSTGQYAALKVSVFQ